MPIVPWGQVAREYVAEDRCITQHTASWPNGKPFTGNVEDVRHLFVPSIQRHTVDCQQFQQMITSAVDQRLSRLEMEAFIDHAAKCGTCRYDYELESSVKAVVKSRLPMVKTPHGLTESISQKLHQIGLEQAEAERRESRARVFNLPLIKPLLLLAILSTVVFFTVYAPFRSAPALHVQSDLVDQSIANYHAVLAGVLQPQVVSDQPEHLRGFFSGKTDFPVHVPALAAATLVGGSANEYRGMKLAHLMYRHGGELIYLFQAPYDRVMEGNGLALSPEAKTELTRAGSFSNVAPGGDSVLLWVLGNTLCVAVSRMNRDELDACFASDPESGKERRK